MPHAADARACRSRSTGRAGPIEAIPFRFHHGDIDALGFRFGDTLYTPDLSDVPPESTGA